MGVTGWGGFVTLTLEMDLSQAVEDIGSVSASYLARWDAAVWDTDTWLDGTTWTDITQWVMGIDTNRSFSQELTAYNAGRMSFTLDNTDGRFSPDNTSSPYRVGDSTTIGMLRPVRLTALYINGNFSYTWPIFTGRLESWDEVYTGPEMAEVHVTAVDAFADLGAVDPYAQTALGAGDDYQTRIERILTNAGYTGDRSLDTGVNTFQATTLAANALTELKLTADSEGGAVWVGADGSFIADGQNALIQKARSNTTQVLFVNSDVDSGGSGFSIGLITVGYDIDSVSPKYDGSRVVNVANYAIAGGTQQTSVAPESRSLYGDRIASRTDLVCETDAMALTLAERQVALYSNPERRIESLRFSPILQPSSTKRNTAWTMLATEAIQLRALVAIDHVTPAGFTISKDLFIRGISHKITPTTWDVDLSFTSATVYAGLVNSRWDVGVWDTNGWSW